MSGLVAATLATLVLFAVSGSYLSFRELYVMETDQAAERAAQAAASYASRANWIGRPEAEIRQAVDGEVRAVSRANLSRGRVETVTITFTTAGVGGAIRVDVRLVARFDGFGGPFTVASESRAGGME